MIPTRAPFTPAAARLSSRAVASAQKGSRNATSESISRSAGKSNDRRSNIDGLAKAEGQHDISRPCVNSTLHIRRLSKKPGSRAATLEDVFDASYEDMIKEPFTGHIDLEDEPDDLATGQESINKMKSRQSSKFLSEFVRLHVPPLRAVHKFSSKPWTKSILEADEYKLIPFYSRYLDERNGESRFFARTVHSDREVPYVLGLCRKDLWPESGNRNIKVDKSLPEFMALMHMGRDLEAHPGIVNGGFQGVIFDEVMYCTILLHAHRDEESPVRPKHYTLDLTTRFKAPVKIKTDILVRANVVSRQDRKWTVEGEIVDSEGNVLTQGESHWLTAKKSVS